MADNRDHRGRFVSGNHVNRMGRPKGTPNKLTREVRELVRNALDEAGGIEYLVWASRAHPAAFMALIGKLIPAEVRATLDADLTTVVLKDYTGVPHGEPPDAIEQRREGG